MSFSPIIAKNPMKKEVSIVLSVERRDYRKLAQKWYGLTGEQMIDMDVHHNPARHDGGRDIPEHLYVYHNTLHSAVHDDEFVLWAREGGRKGGFASAGKGVGCHTAEARKRGGERAGQRNKENKTGICGMTLEKRKEAGIKGGVVGGRKVTEEKLGIHGATPEQRSEWGREGALKAMQMGVGCIAASSEQLSEWSRMSDGAGGRKAKEMGVGIHAPGQQAAGGRRTQELGVGVFSLTKEQQRELGKKTTSQRWRCLETGHISTPGGLSRFQKARGIDTSLRERLE